MRLILWLFGLPWRVKGPLVDVGRGAKKIIAVQWFDFNNVTCFQTTTMDGPPTFPFSCKGVRQKGKGGSLTSRGSTIESSGVINKSQLLELKKMVSERSTGLGRFGGIILLTRETHKAKRAVGRFG